jgi:hypothetical protein
MKFNLYPTDKYVQMLRIVLENELGSKEVYCTREELDEIIEQLLQARNQWNINLNT